MKKRGMTFVTIVFIFGIIAGGTYYWKWQTLQHVAIVSQPVAIISTEEDKEEEPSTPTRGWINLLVLGTDNPGDEVARSDLMMLVSANADTHQASVISIPRDTRVNIPGVGLTKINHANAIGEINGGVHEGTQESAKAVSNLLGVTINYYVKINFQGFQKAVDTVGGIDINLPGSVKDNLQDIHLLAGENHLSGDEALRLARARYGLPNGDFDRQRNQFYLFAALGHQLLNLSNISKLPQTLNAVQEDFIDTNLSTSEMVALGLSFKGMTKETIKYYQLPGQGTSAPDPLVGASVYYYEPDMEGVKKIVQEAMKL